jgi:hypothetical protein
MNRALHRHQIHVIPANLRAPAPLCDVAMAHACSWTCSFGFEIIEIPEHRKITQTRKLKMFVGHAFPRGAAHRFSLSCADGAVVACAFHFRKFFRARWRSPQRKLASRPMCVVWPPMTPHASLMTTMILEAFLLGLCRVAGFVA